MRAVAGLPSLDRRCRRRQLNFSSEQFKSARRLFSFICGPKIILTILKKFDSNVHMNSGDGMPKLGVTLTCLTNGGKKLWRLH